MPAQPPSPPRAARDGAPDQPDAPPPLQGDQRTGGRLPVVGPAVLDRLDRLTGMGLFSLCGHSRQGRPIARGTFSFAGDAASRSALAARSCRLLFVGGVHGDEPASVEALLDLAQRLVGASEARPGDRFPDGAVAITVIPALNPDGVAVGTKNAASDVDLNRNFPARNFTTDHAPGYHPGPAPLSEPETALLGQLIDQQRIEAVVAVHAPFACVNYDGPAREWADQVARACGWPVRESIGYPTPGSLGSWLGVDRNLPVLTLELPPGPLASFESAAAAALDAACAAVPWAR